MPHKMPHYKQLYKSLHRKNNSAPEITVKIGIVAGDSDADLGEVIANLEGKGKDSLLYSSNSQPVTFNDYEARIQLINCNPSQSIHSIRPPNKRSPLDACDAFIFVIDLNNAQNVDDIEIQMRKEVGGKRIILAAQNGADRADMPELSLVDKSVNLSAPGARESVLEWIHDTVIPEVAPTKPSPGM